MKTALVAGATGLVGKELVKQLLDDLSFDLVTVFVRRSMGIVHPRLKEFIVHFDDMHSWGDRVVGDVLFSTMGTTLKQAGSKEAQKKVDYAYQYGIARIAAHNGVPEYVLVSTPGASPGSIIFYSRIRGELDRDVKELPFKRVIILKPSVLAGKREDRRPGEEMGIKIGNLLKKIPGLSKYRPIQGSQVARAMIGAFREPTKERVTEYVLNELFQF